MKKERTLLFQLVFTALSMAIVCVGTMAIQIPIPLGYMHFGNICILLVSTYLNPTSAFLASGVGSALSDLLSGYPQWIIPTLIIKGIMGLCISLISHEKSNISPVFCLKNAIATFTGILIMIMGYFIAGIALYGSIYTSAAQIPGLCTEGVFGLIGYYILGFALEKAHFKKLFSFGS